MIQQYQEANPTHFRRPRSLARMTAIPELQAGTGLPARRETRRDCSPREMISATRMVQIVRGQRPESSEQPAQKGRLIRVAPMLSWAVRLGTTREEFHSRFASSPLRAT